MIRCYHDSQDIRYRKPTGALKENETVEKIEENIVKSIIKNDDLFLVNLKCSSYSINVFHQVYNCLIKHNVVPIHFINNSSSVFNVNFLIKSNVFNKFQRCLDTELNMFNASFINVSRIAIVGYGIANNGKMLENILAIIKNFGIDILNVDVTNTKVVITFKDIMYYYNILATRKLPQFNRTGGDDRA